jgi:Protein of unknown function (DUF3515)
LIAVAVALPVALVVGIIVAAVLAGRLPGHTPISLGTVPAPEADGPECTQLVAALPADLGEYTGLELAEPAPPATKAWGGDAGDFDRVVLRCGLDRPLQFDAAAALQVVDGVQWFEVSDPGQSGFSTWYVVDRDVYIALTVPTGSGPTPVQEVSATVNETLPARPIDPAPLPN